MELKTKFEIWWALSWVMMLIGLALDETKILLFFGFMIVSIRLSVLNLGK